MESTVRVARISETASESSPAPNSWMGSRSPDRLPTIYVEGLHQSCTQEKLREALAVFGHVVQVHLKEGRHGHSRKFAFVSFSSHEDMEKALGSSGKLVLDGQKIIIKPSHKNQQHSAAIGQQEPQQHGIVYKQEPLRQLKFTELQLLVTHVETPVCFYAQTSGNHMLGTVYAELATHCPSANHLSGIPNSNQVYGAKYSLDGNWYRCKVVKQASESQSIIFFIDYGNCEVVGNASLVQLPANMSELPPLAKKYYLYGLEAKDEPGSVRSCEGATLLLNLVSTHPIRAKIYDDNQAELFCNGDSNVGEHMVTTGYCVSAQMHTGLSGDGDGRTPHVSVGRASGSHPGSISCASDKTLKKPGTIPALMDERIEQSNVLSKSTENGQRQPTAAFATGSRPINNGCSSSASVTSCSSSITDSDASLYKQLQEYCARTEQLTAECSHLKEQLAELKSRPSLDQRLASVIETAASIKKLRLRLQLDDDPIISSMLQLSEEKHRMESISDTLLADVERTVSFYGEIQDRIRFTYMSLDKAKALEIVQQRDEAREKLCEAISSFEKQLSGLDLDGRKAHLKTAGDRVSSAYADLLINLPESEENVADYQLEQLLKWRAERDAVVTALRDSSDAAIQKLSNRLAALMKSLDIANNFAGPALWTTTGDCSFEADIESCCKALTAELGHSHIVPNSTDVAVIRRGVKAFKSLASAITDVIASLESNSLRYREMRNRLTPWINKTPELTQAVALWKHLKMLRSRLRHRLADRQDIIENVHDDSVKASSDLAAITDELSRLQPELQECCLTLEGMLGAVAADCSEHFPELTLQHSDLSLADFAKYCGLYSPFRDLEHFSDVRHPDGSSNWLCVFNGIPVEIRQYQVGGPGYSTKSAVLAYFMKVKRLWETNLQSVFFSKNPSEVLVQVISHTENLTTRKRPLSSNDVAAYSTQILLQLQKLHAEDFVYGCLNPQSVFVEPYGCILDVPGLPTQKNYVPVDMNGLTFNQEEASKLSDLKDFGKLLIWMCCPEMERPAHSHVSHNRELYDLVSCLLYGQPKTVEEIFDMPYFTSLREPALKSPSHLQHAADAPTPAEPKPASDAAAAVPAPVKECDVPAEATSPVGLPGSCKVPTSAWLAATTQSLLSAAEVAQALNVTQPVEVAAPSDPAATHSAPHVDIPDGDLRASVAAPPSK